MIIGFEAKRLFTNFTGLGNYGRFIVGALSQYFPDNEYLLFTPRSGTRAEIASITGRPNITVVTPSGMLALPWMSALWRSWLVTRSEAFGRLSIFHGLSQELPRAIPSGVVKIVTVHDLIFMRYPDYYSVPDIKIYTAKVKAACEEADVVVAISEQTKEDVIAFLGIPEDKIHVVYQGCHPLFHRAADSAVKERYGLPGRYILNVGTIESRKNIAVGVQALAMMPVRDRVPLVIVGRQTAYTETVRKVAADAGVSDMVRFIHHAAFEDLPAIYQGASVFLYPSQFEGFGIPLVEAIACGLPVVTSTGSCFREAAGPYGLYADPADAALFAQHLLLLLNDQQEREARVEGSRNFIRKFAPEQIARDMMNLYTSVA